MRRGGGVIVVDKKNCHATSSKVSKWLRFLFSSRSIKMTIPDETIFIENNNEFD